MAPPEVSTTVPEIDEDDAPTIMALSLSAATLDKRVKVCALLPNMSCSLCPTIDKAAIAAFQSAHLGVHS